MAWAVAGVIALSLLATWVRAGNPLQKSFPHRPLTETGPYTPPDDRLVRRGVARLPAVMVDYREVEPTRRLARGAAGGLRRRGWLFVQVPPVAEAVQRSMCAAMRQHDVTSVLGGGVVARASG